MINFGAAATWKVRSLIAARHLAWSNRPPSSADSLPPPAGAAHISSLEATGPAYAISLDNDPTLQHWVARGPLPRGNRVHDDLLNCNRGMWSGSARLERPFPLLTRLGPYSFEARTGLLTDAWQYSQMGMRHNGQRRIPVIYDLVEPPLARFRAFVRAVNAVLDPQLQWFLRALDHDDEFIAYQRRFAHSVIMSWADTPPDFHPQLIPFCSRDPQLARRRVDELIDRIGDVPKYLARGFKVLYERVIQELEWQIANDPSLTAGDIARLRDEILQLSRKRDALQSHLQAGSST
jgi:hypothetical protein